MIKNKTIERERITYNKIRYNRYQRKTIIYETITGWSFISPLLLVALIFSTTAIGIAFYLSLHSGIWGKLKYVGFNNWKLLSSPGVNFNAAFLNTIKFAGIAVPIIIIVSLTLSAILNSSNIKGKQFFLSMFFIPQITSSIAVTLIFTKLFAPHGIIHIDYFKDPKLVMWIVIISTIWGGVAGSLITMNTAFATIDKSQYEAAEIDGASVFKKFTRITVPSIMPIISYSLFMGIIGGLAVFDAPYIMANALHIPGDGLTTLVLRGYSFIMGAQHPNIGLGTTIIFATSLIMMLSTFVVNLLLPMNKKVK